MNRTDARVWMGRTFSALAMLVMIGSALAKFARTPEMVGGLAKAGFPDNAILPIATLELLCALLYLWRRTAIVGTLLVTGYLGGAIVVQIVSRQSVAIPVIVGMSAWVGTYLRIRELRNFLRVENRLSANRYDRAV
jgi:hypothetical protein